MKMRGILGTIAEAREWIKQVQRQTNPTIATDQANALVDNVPGSSTRGVTYYTISSTTDPSAGFGISNTGVEWLNPNTSVLQWWDGHQWRSGAFPYQNNGDITMFAARALVTGRTFFDVSSQASAPSSPATGDVWVNGSTQSRWSGSAWVVYTDTVAKAVITAAIAAYANNIFRVFCRGTTPTATDNGDLWIDTDDWKLYVWSISSWNYIPIPGDIVGTVLTASKFQTSEFGQRMEMSADTVGGVVKFWTGDASETGPGWINPTLALPSWAGGFAGPAVEIASPNVGGRGKLQVFPDFFNMTKVLNLEAGLIARNNSDVTTQGSGNVVSAHKLYTLNPDTTTNASNTRISGTGDLTLVTSLKKDKIKHISLSADAVRGLLDLNVRSWYDRAEWNANGQKEEGLERIPGLFAEDVEEHAPLFAEHDAEGNLRGVQYERVGVAWIPLMREVFERLEKLERDSDD
jgi:hypothetical protein